MDSKKPRVTLVTDTDCFFKELLSSALQNQSIDALPETEVYLVKLLSHFISSENLFARDSSGNFRAEPLALMLKEAIEEQRQENQRLLFRQVGDVSLYTAGFFQESLDRKPVGVNYYIGIGGGAYSEVAVRHTSPANQVYMELSERFSEFVDVLAEVGEATGNRSDVDLIRAYERWLETESAHALKTLQKAGITPTIPKFSKKDNIQ